MAQLTIEKKVERMLLLYQRLRDGEVISKAVMAEECQVNIRTIQRDIDDLRGYFANRSVDSEDAPLIVYDRKRKGYYMDQRSERLSDNELIAVCKILLESRAFTKKELNPIIRKLIGSLVNENKQKWVADMIANEQYHYVEPHHQKEIVADIGALEKAIQRKKYVKIWYQKLTCTEPVIRQIKPVGIMFSEYYFYLIAFIETDEKYKAYQAPAIYRIDRIKKFEVMEEHFSIQYKDRFEEGEFRKRVQFMFGGSLQRIELECPELSLEAILDRLPTAEIINVIPDESGEHRRYVIRAEVFGNGIDLWLKGQGEMAKIISRRKIE